MKDDITIAKWIKNISHHAKHSQQLPFPAEFSGTASSMALLSLVSKLISHIADLHADKETEIEYIELPHTEKERSRRIIRENMDSL